MSKIDPKFTEDVRRFLDLFDMLNAAIPERIAPPLREAAEKVREQLPPR